MTKRLVLGVTDPLSLVLMKGVPEHLCDEWDVHVVTSPGAAPPRGATLHEIAMRRQPSPLRDIGALIQWIYLLLRLRPRLVMVGTPKAGLLGTVAALIVRVPRRIYMLRGLRAETSSGFQRRLLLILERLAVASATEVLTVSDSLAQEAQKLSLGPKEKFIVLGSGSSNGVDLRKFSNGWNTSDRHSARQQFGLTVDTAVVGFVGRITPDKGLLTLAGALASMRATGGGQPQLLIVGAAEDADYAKRVRSVLEAARVNFTVVGHVEDVTRVYRAMDVLCLPSLREGFPNVVLEAAASGIPAICSDATGCRDAVIDGQTGFLFPVGDQHALNTQISRALADPTMLQALGRQARERVVLEFDRRIVWENLAHHLSDPLWKPTISSTRDGIGSGLT